MAAPATPTDYPVRTAQQLSPLLQAFRKQAGLTQAQAAARLGVTQQTLSALERSAARVSVGRLLNLLGLLGVDLVLRQRDAASPASRAKDKAAW